MRFGSFVDTACSPLRFQSLQEKELAGDKALSGMPMMDSYLSVWIGGAGAVTQAHYDVAHNVFVQLHGTKRFTCWGPGAHVGLHVFPDAHPRARSSQPQNPHPILTS